VETIDAATRKQVAAATRFDHEVGARAALTISTCEASFVGLLLMCGPLTPGQLGQLNGLSSSGTITGVIDRLERAGYVRRERDTHDRRKVIVTLNREWLDQESAPRTRRLAGILADYNEDQLAVIADFLTRLADTEAAATTSAPLSQP
jgi:DNA-binding MarR family transcriptional regulator